MNNQNTKKPILAEQANPDLVDQLVRGNNKPNPPKQAANPNKQNPNQNRNKPNPNQNRQTNPNQNKQQAKPAPAAQGQRKPNPNQNKQQAKPAPAAQGQRKPNPNQNKQQTKPAPAAQGQRKPNPNQNKQQGQRPPTQNKPSVATQGGQNKNPNQNRQQNPNQNRNKPNPNQNRQQGQRKTNPNQNRQQNPNQNRAPQGKPQQQRRGTSKNTLKIIPLGGLGEIGKNITYYEYGNDALLVDCGIAFPDESMPGIDIVIPDFTYVIENQKKIRGLCITHGHEDHIGSIPYLLKHFNVPLYGTRLTLGLVEGKLKEHGLLRNAKLNVVKAGDTVKLGSMSAEFIHVNHSIPDACAIAIHTPLGPVIQTGDFKIDFTPIAGETMDLARLGELGNQGVLALFADSTNAETPGFAQSERVVGVGLNRLFADSPDKRIIVATFASNVHRVQQLMDAAVKHGRKVAVSGRSMENVTAIALELGYLKAPKDLLITIDQAESMPPEKVALITTGSQGEPMSALTRMARGDHRKIRVTENDVIILSANPIPGNEKAVTKVINDLLVMGADVAHDKDYKLHVSGHANQAELKMILALTKPKYFIPAHGEFKHLRRHGEMAVSMGVPASNMHIGENGDVIEISPQGMKKIDTVTAGAVFVDGLGVGDVGAIVLRDRKHLAEDGLIVVISTIDRKTGKILAGPDIVSRGFVYVRESEDIISKARSIARRSLETSVRNGRREWGALKSAVRDDVGDFVWQTTKRRPMILPVIQEVN